MKYHPDYGFDPAGHRIPPRPRSARGSQGHTPDPYGTAHAALQGTILGPRAPGRPGRRFPRNQGYRRAQWAPWTGGHGPTWPHFNRIFSATLPCGTSLPFGHYDLFRRELRDIIDLAGASKVLFGTDGPVYPVAGPVTDWVELIRDLPDRASEGNRFTREEVDAVLGGNAAKNPGAGVVGAIGFQRPEVGQQFIFRKLRLEKTPAEPERIRGIRFRGSRSYSSL